MRIDVDLKKRTRTYFEIEDLADRKGWSFPRTYAYLLRRGLEADGLIDDATNPSADHDDR